MDHRYIDEHQVVDRYLMNRLPADEARRFEDHYLHCQNCVDQLETAEKLQRGLKRAAAEDAARVAVARRLGVLAWLASRTRPTRLALTALALAALVLPATLATRELGRLGRELDSARTAVAELRRPQVNTALFSLGPERGAPPGDTVPSHVVRLTGEPEWLVLSLQLERIEHRRYRVVLLRGKEEVWRDDGLEPDHLDALVLSLHSSWLEAGDYLARVEPSTPAADPLPIARFSFRVVPSD